MKKINSIGYAHKIIGLAILFLVVIPLCFYYLFLMFHVELFSTLICISIGIGLIITFFFIVLLIVELKQDKNIDRKYIKIKKKKLALGNGLYECQSCGSRQVTATDKNCGICGIRFDNQGSSPL